jgi:hypothetical protein
VTTTNNTNRMLWSLDRDPNNESHINTDDDTKMKVWKQQYHCTMYKQMKCLWEAIQSIPGLSIPTIPNATMYMMVQIHIHEYFDRNYIKNDIEFSQLLYQEENVLVLPGSCFYKKDVTTTLQYNSMDRSRNSSKPIIDLSEVNYRSSINKHCPRIDPIQNSSNPDVSTSESTTCTFGTKSHYSPKNGEKNDIYFVRIVFCAPCEELVIATDRIRQFCIKYQKSP